MKIVHFCLSCFYVDGFSYQENRLVQEHVAAGHSVTVVASTETVRSDGSLDYLEPGEYLGEDGARVIRLPYRYIGIDSLERKLRMHGGIRRILLSLAPEVVIFHGLCGYEITTVARHCRRQGVRLVVDSHEDKHNSARNWLSAQLHRLYYRPLCRSALRLDVPVHCISLETMDFVERVYGFRREQLRFLPLGGVIPDDAEYERRRLQVRSTMALADDDVLVLQTGKMGDAKRPLASIAALREAGEANLRLCFAGTFSEDIAEAALDAIGRDDRICHVGWLGADELLSYLCAADIYLQPGSQSATMQQSLCARTAVILDNVPSHVPFVSGNGFLISNVKEMTGALTSLARKPDLARSMGEKSLAIARELLDYRVQAASLIGV